MVTFPFRSVETERKLCHLPFYHLYTAGLFPFHVGQLCTSVLIANVTLQYATPMPVDRVVQKKLWKASYQAASEITITFVIKTPLFEYLPSYLSLDTALCS